MKLIPLLRSALPVSFALACTSLQAVTYSLVDLGEGYATDINASGKVVGNNGAAGWYFDGTSRTNLIFDGLYDGMPPEAAFKNLHAASANAISDNGQITGHLIFPINTVNPYRYNGVDPAMIFNPITPGRGINDAGSVVGETFRIDGNTVSSHPGVQPRAYAINAGGFAAGSVSPNGQEVAATFLGPDAIELNLAGLNLPELPRGGSYSSKASSINAGGIIVGNVTMSVGGHSQTGWGFIYAGTTASALGGLGGSFVQANDINDNGLIVGRATLLDGTPHAVLFTDGIATDLNLQLATGGDGWVLTEATAVNQAGQIVGLGTKNGEVRAFLLNPASNDLPPSIAAQPQGTTVFAGRSIELAVTASGTGPFTYQWTHAGTNLPNATAASYSVASAAETDDGVYKVVVSNAFGSKESLEARVTVRVAAALAIARYAGLWITGAPGRSYEVQAAESAQSAEWTTVATITLGAEPTFWLDANSPDHPNRIYRSVSVAPTP